MCGLKGYCLVFDGILQEKGGNEKAMKRGKKQKWYVCIYP